MTLEEVMKIDDVSERLRAFTTLPQAEKDLLFTPEERATSDATDELYQKYLKVAEQTFAELGRVLNNDSAVDDALVLLLRVQAANELRCELARIPTPTLDSTFGASDCPFPLFKRDFIETHKQQIRREVMT